MRDFRQLDVWHAAHALTLQVYRLTQTFPREEIYGLTSQIRRSSSSVAANIAEGCGRDTDRDFLRFLGISGASATETEYQLLLARDLGYVATDLYVPADELVQKTKRMIVGLSRRIRTDLNARSDDNPPTANG